MCESRGMTHSPAFVYTVGSHQFGLALPESDIDLIYVYVDFLSRIDPTRANPSYVTKQESDTEDIIYLEYGEFISRVQSGKLREVEAYFAGDDSLVKVTDNPLYTFTLQYFTPYDYELYLNMYETEIKARYNGFFGEKRREGYFRPDNKNYNPKVGYSSKDAMHLLRVLASALYFKQSGRFCVNVGASRDFYMKVREGVPLEIFKTVADGLLEDFLKMPVLKKAQRDKVSIPSALTAEGVYAELIKSRLVTYFDGQYL